MPKSLDASKLGVGAREVQSRVQIKVSKQKWLPGSVVFVNEVPKSAAGKIQEDTKGVGEERLAARHGEVIDHEKARGGRTSVHFTCRYINTPRDIHVNDMKQ